MKREEIKAIFANATDEQLSAILDINGADIEKVKRTVAALEADLQKKTADFDSLAKELGELKANNAANEDFKAQLERLQSEIAQKEAKEKADREAKEKADAVTARFGAVVGDKKFTHEAIKADYLRKFGEALENKDFTGKSDAEILHELTKDDGAAFQNVTAFRLEGGTNKGVGAEIDDAATRAIMGLPPLK